MPALGVIRDKFSFTEVAAAAGLVITPRTTRSLLPRSEAVILFVEHCGFLPRQADLAWFARQHRIQLVSRSRELHRQAITAARVTAEDQDRPFPAHLPVVPPPGWQHAASRDSPALAQARERYPAARKGGYGIEEVRGAIRRAFDLSGPGVALTQERYRALSTAHGLPSPSVIQRLGSKHGTSFGTLVREIASERATGCRST